MQPIIISWECIKAVTDFKHLGSVIEVHGEVMKDVEDKIVRASRAFGALCRPVLQDGSLHVAKD